MNSLWVSGLVLVAGTTVCLAASRSAGTCSVNDTTDSGGLRATSANYETDGSLGGIGGISSNASPSETVKHGYIGQLTEVTNLVVIASPASTNEGSVVQLTGLALLDDATVSAVTGGDITWGVPGFPIASITPSGAATTAVVWSNTYGVVAGAYLGLSGSTFVLVMDSDPDNYGLYGSDQVPDSWQVRWFGINNPLGMAWATNCSGQNNLYTYIADLNPTDSNSTFRVVAISNQPPNRVVCFSSTSTERVYRLLYSTNLVGGVWTNLPGAMWASGQGGQMSLTDTNAAAIRFYQVHVQVP